MTPLFPSPVVSEWFIQGQTQSQTITLVCNRSVASLEEVKEKSRGGWKKMDKLGWGVENTERHQGSSGHAPKRSPLTYAGLISAFLTASVILLRHLQLRHMRRRWACDRVQTQRGSIRPLSLFGNNQVLFFFKSPVGGLEWRRVDDLMQTVGMSWNIWAYFIIIVRITPSLAVTEFLRFCPGGDGSCIESSQKIWTK